MSPIPFFEALKFTGVVAPSAQYFYQYRAGLSEVLICGGDALKTDKLGLSYPFEGMGRVERVVME